MAWKRLAMVVATLSMLACGGSKKTALTPAPSTASGAGLWSLAPSSAAAGIVAADGSLAVIQAALVEFVRIADARVESNEIADEMRQEFASGPINPLDSASLAAAGIDIAKGAALFVDAQDRIFGVLPVTDRRAFVAATGGSTEVDGELEIDRFGNTICTTRSGRYLCANDAASLAELGSTPANGLAQLAMDSPRARDGELTMIVDSSRYDLARRFSGIERYMQNMGALVVAARMDRGRLMVRAHLAGTLTARGQKLAAASSVLGSKVGAERPSGGMRVSLDTGELPIPDQEVPMSGLRLPEIVRSLTGELVTFAHAGANGSVALQVGLSSRDALDKLLSVGCSMAGVVPFLEIGLEGSSCVGSIDLSAMPDEARRLVRAKRVALDIGVRDDRLDIRIAAGAKGPVTNAPGASELGAELMGGAWNLAAWGHGLSPVYLLELINMGAIPHEERREMAGVMWLIGHLFEAGFGLGFREDGLHGVLEVTTFAAAPPEIYSDYEAALGRAIGGDFSGAVGALDAIAQKAPSSIVARQVGLKSGAWLGGIALGAGVWLGLVRSGGADDEAPPEVVAPDVD